LPGKQASAPLFTTSSSNSFKLNSFKSNSI
jgi:hypothetical protein